MEVQTVAEAIVRKKILISVQRSDRLETDQLLCVYYAQTAVLEQFDPSNDSRFP